MRSIILAWVLKRKKNELSCLCGELIDVFIADWSISYTRNWAASIFCIEKGMLGWAALTFFKIYGCFGILQLIFFSTIYEGKTAISFLVLHVICLLTSNLSVFSSFSSLHYYWMSDVQMSYDHIKFCNVGFSSFMLSYMLFAV